MTRFARTARAARGLRLRRARSFALAGGAAPRGPGPHPGAPRAAWGCASLAPDPHRCARLGPVGALFAHSASPLAPGPLPLRGSAPARRARRRFAGPVRRFRPRFARRPRPRAVPPGSPARPLVRRIRGSAGARWPRLPAAPPLLRCGLPVRSALLRAGLGLVQRVAPPGPPSARPSGFGGGWLRARGLRGRWPRSGRVAPRALSARPRLRGLAGSLAACGPRLAALPGFYCPGCGGPVWARLRLWRAAAVPVGFSPAAPPPRPPPLGAPGGPGARRVASPPAAWVALLAPLLRAPPRCARPPGGPIRPRLTVRKLSTGVYTERVSASAAALPLSAARQGQAPSGRGCARSVAADAVLAPALTGSGREICPAGLTFPGRRGILVFRCPFRSFGGRPSRGVRGRQKPLGLIDQAAFFHAPGAPQPCRKCAPLLAPAARSALDTQSIPHRTQQNLCYFVALDGFK